MVDGEVVVRSFTPGSDSSDGGVIAATLSMVEINGGFAVAEATTDSVTIDPIEPVATDNSITVSGSGTGFEATLDVTVMSAVDNRVLAETFTQAGNFGELGPYSVDVSLAGTEHSWIMVSSSGGADGVINPFAATQVSYNFRANDQTEYAVIGVAPDDRDGGLVVRVGPGTSNSRVSVIPAGTGGLRRNSVFPVAVGDDIWWSVSAPTGVSGGWVNSRFVASNEPISDDAARSVASTFQQAAAGDPGIPLTSLPFSRRAPVLVGTIDSPVAVPADELLLAEAWAETRSFPMPEVYGQPREASLDDFMWTPRWGAAEVQPNGVFSYRSDREVAETYFAGLSSVVIAPDNPNSPWDRTFLFMESTPGGPEVVGMVVEVHQP